MLLHDFLAFDKNKQCVSEINVHKQKNKFLNESIS